MAELSFTDVREIVEVETRRLREALDAGIRFERAYQESLGATPTATQAEILDRLHGQFFDAYMALKDSDAD